MASRSEIIDWLNQFAAAVRGRDLVAGRSLFAVDVAAFGTRADIVMGLDALVDQQWRPIWNATQDFQFDLSQLQFGGSGDTAWVAAPWRSQGMTAQGRWVNRAGRATYVLQKQTGRWLAVHSHHSRCPSAAPEQLIDLQLVTRVG